MNSASNFAGVDGFILPNGVGYADWHDIDLSCSEEICDSIEMAGFEYGMSDSMISCSRPIMIHSTRSSVRLNCSRSPTETFLSAASPFELPFVPTTRTASHNSPTCHAPSQDQQLLPQRPKCTRPQCPLQVSSLTNALALQDPCDRLACRRQLRRKESLVQRNQEVPCMKRPTYALNLDNRPDSYNYSAVTSW